MSLPKDYFSIIDSFVNTLIVKFFFAKFLCAPEKNWSKKKKKNYYSTRDTKETSSPSPRITYSQIDKQGEIKEGNLTQRRSIGERNPSASAE